MNSQSKLPSSDRRVDKTDVLLLLLIVALGLSYQSIFLSYGVGLIDEGHLPNAARRITQGDVLYKDVYSLYPPASFYLVALLFKIFGDSLLLVRLFHVVMTLCLSVSSYFFSKKLMPRGWAFLAAVLPAISGWEAFTEHGHYSYLYGVFPILCLLCLSRHLQSPDERKWIFGTGVLTGVTLCFRLVPFVGIAAAVSVAATLRSRSLANYFREIMWFGVGILSVLVPTFLFFLVQSGGEQFLRSVFWTSIYQYLGEADLNLPFPKFEPIPSGWTRSELQRTIIIWEFYLPFFIYMFALLELAFATWIQKQPLNDARILRLALTIFGIAILTRALGRSDYYHLAPVLAPVFLLGVYFLSRICSRVRPARVVMISGAIIVSSLYLHNVDGILSYRMSTENQVEVPGTGVYVDRKLRLAELVTFLQNQTKPGEPIFVVPSCPLIYFVSDRPNPTRYDWLFRGYLSAEGAEEDLIETIDQSSVRIVVYSTTQLDNQPDRSLPAFASQLNVYFNQNFTVNYQFGEFLILQRRDVP